MRAALLVLLCSSVASALKPGAAALSVLLCGSVASALKPGAAFLDAARLRTNSAAREAFAAEVALPKPDSLRLLVAIAAEEHPEIPVIACTERVRCALDDLTALLDANRRDYNAGFTHYGRLSHESYAYQRALEKAHDYLTFAIASAMPRPPLSKLGSLWALGIAVSLGVAEHVLTKLLRALRLVN